MKIGDVYVNHLTLHNGCNYLSTLELEFTRVSMWTRVYMRMGGWSHVWGMSEFHKKWENVHEFFI